MLRASVKKTGEGVDLRAIIDERHDPGLDWGGPLRALATAMSTGTGLEPARATLAAVASEAVVAAAVGVCANFEMMNRILDATGCPVPDHARPMARHLGLAREAVGLP
jgi:hypothetical protein